MTAVVHCLRVWRHYPLGSPFLVKTTNVATSDFFQTQKKLSPKQRKGYLTKREEMHKKRQAPYS